MDDEVRCVCGHPLEAHEHYRSGTDCSLCGGRSCPRFRPGGSRLDRLRSALVSKRSD